MADLKLQAVISVANKASAPLRQINSDLNKMRAPLRGLIKSVKGLDRASGFRELRGSVAGLSGQLAKVGVVGVGAAAGLVAAVSKMAATGDEISKTATNFDISTDALQEWRFVAERSGVSTETITKSMQAFTKRLAEARNGSGELFGLLKKVNPEFLTQVLAIDNNTDAYDFMIKAMAKLPDQQRQILLGDKAFSEAGRELVKITAQGADEIERLKKEAREYGFVLDKETLKKSSKFRDMLTNVSSVIRNLSFAIGSELMPEIASLVKGLLDWYKLNKDVINVKVAEFAKKAAKSIKELAKWVVDIAPGVFNFVEAMGGLKTIAIAAAAILAGPLLGAIVTLGVALTATPLGAFITAVSVLAVGAKALYDNFEPFRELMIGIVGSVVEFIDLIANNSLVSTLSGLAKSLFDGGEKLFPEIPPATQELVRTVTDKGQPSLLQQARSPVSKSSGLLTRGQQKTEMAGKVEMVIKSEAPVKVNKITSNNPDFGLDVVYSGKSLMAL